MKAAVPTLVLLAATCLLVPAPAQAAGFAHDENFVVLAPDQALANAVLAKANEFRKQAAKEWLGEELPPSIGQSVIHVEYSNTEDSALTWPIDSPGRTLHKVWLTTNTERAIGSTLHHEITHVVLATQFPERLPAWADEGAASLADNPERVAARKKILAWYAKTGNWPSVKTVFEARSVNAKDQATYSVAASLTQYLLTRADKSAFLRFAQAGKTQGWDRALKEHYDIQNVGELQTAWQAWAGTAGERAAPSARH